ncbi:MAG: hypothetical protein IJI57_04305 [Flexilinea sp.]|nr:hypothetical protein [Flexilinea sp.]
MGRGYHRLYYRDENGVRHAVGTATDSQYNQMRKNANDAITQRRDSGQGNTPTIKLSGNNKNTKDDVFAKLSDKERTAMMYEVLGSAAPGTKREAEKAYKKLDRKSYIQREGKELARQLREVNQQYNNSRDSKELDNLADERWSLMRTIAEFANQVEDGVGNGVLNDFGTDFAAYSKSVSGIERIFGKVR